jgi:hypothetical protein
MPVTTVAAEVKRLRSYLSPYLRGPNVDAILTALATGSSSYLINNAASVNEQMYITTAAGEYLDQRLADFGITRPEAVGLSDEIFSQIGIQVKNRKQVRDLINELLDDMFGDQFVRASESSSMYEPYVLADGDTLIVNFDEHETATIVFHTNEFENIAAATAQEVADAITKSLRSQGLTGTALEQDNGNGPYVVLLSDTIGPASSVTVVGGSAQNQLLFPAVVPAGGNASTQWTLSLRPGGVVRFTWTGGANPQLGRIELGNYVNVFGGGFASSSNQGSYVITKAIGGIAGVSYFEIENPIGTSGVVVQGTDDAVRFYNPVRQTLAARFSYASVYQTQSRVLQIFIPASTRVVRRSRIGSAHLHDAPNGVFTFEAQPNSGDTFAITTTVSLVAGADFPLGGTITGTALNFVTAVNTNIAGVVAIPGKDIKGNIIVTIWNDSLTNTLVAAYIGAANILASGPLGDPLSLQPNQPGPYIYDTTQPFVVSAVQTSLSQELDATKPKIFQVTNSSNFPDQAGYLIFEYGSQNQEGPVPYISRPSDSSLLISPAYTIKTRHAAGTSVELIAQKSPVVPAIDGSSYQFFLTDVVAGRIYAQDLINSICATGISIVWTILYPNDIGLGKWHTKYSEISYVWGP